MSKAIEIINYGFRYTAAKETTLFDCNAVIDHGEFVVLAGHSGAGKSTLLSGIIGSIPQMIPGESTGEILVDGESVIGCKISKIARKVGSVLQNADSQIVHGKVEDEVAFGCENMGIDTKDIAISVNEACAKMELEKTVGTGYLSGGQKQRLITATTLAMKQKILIFDEPLANLDLESSHKLMIELKSLCKQGYAVLFVEHRLDLVMQYADRVIWLENGRIKDVRDHMEEFMRHVDLVEDRSRAEASDRVLISLDNISYKADRKEILSNINMEIKERERIVILGENGCGKTTLLRTIAHLNKKITGTVNQYIDTKRKHPARSRWFSEVGFVYQNPDYQLFMPGVYEEISYNAAKGADIESYIEKYHLSGLEKHHPHTLSEGQKRRLSIAAIAAQEPKLLLLDEPTVGQDYDSLMQLIHNINEMRDTLGTAVVTVTHDYRCASAIADKVILMKKGKIIKIGGKELVDEYFDPMV